MKHLAGKFIVFDGGEGCGKTTQAEMVKTVLEKEGSRVLLVRDPGATRISEQIRAILLNPDHTEMNMRCEMLLYMAARAQLMAQTVLPALEKGEVVISDRFVSSTLAYQLGGDGITAQEIRGVADIAIKGRWPDLTVIFDMPVERSAARLKRAKDRIEQRPAEYHQRVRENYLEQAKADPRRHRVVNADRSAEQVHGEVMRAVREL